jgi:DNA-binding transcriptional MocR family regulator
MSWNMHSDDQSRPAVQVKETAQHMDSSDDDPSLLPPAWRSIVIDRSRRGELVSQIVSGVTRLCESGALAAGERLPSVRGISRATGVSTFTVAEAYDRLVANGLVVSRRGAGYFVGARKQARPGTRALAGHATMSGITPLMQELYASEPHIVPVSAGWLPASWHDPEWMRSVERQAIRLSPHRIQGYGHPLGLPELRDFLAQRMAVSGPIRVEPDQILLTRGATHAFDLVLRSFTRPGDAILMESPGYPLLAALIEQYGCRLFRVSRGANGIDRQAFDDICAQTAPKLVFIQTVLQNPLGTTLDASDAHYLVTAAERFDFHLVDNDVCRELTRASAASLAALDGLRRVIRIDSTSKTLSSQLRVGIVCACAAVIQDLARAKMLSGLTSSELEERFVKHAIASSEYRRIVARQQTRLQLAVDNGLHTLREWGLDPIATPESGFFICAGFSDEKAESAPVSAGTALAELAARSGILLLPGQLFTGDKSCDPPWFRFNVAWIDHPRLRDFIVGLKR